MNTKSKGHVTFVTVRSADSDYHVGFCYELAIVLEDKNPDKLLSDLYDAAKGYIQVTRENNLNNKLLDRHEQLPEDLQELYKVVKKQFDNQPVVQSKVPKEYKNSFNMGGAQVSMACV